MPQTLAQLKQKQVLLRILLFSLVTIGVWIGYTLFNSQQQTAIPTDLILLAEPLNPNIDLSVIDRIQRKRVYTEAELSNFPIRKLIHTANGDQVIVESATGTVSATIPTP